MKRPTRRARLLFRLVRYHRKRKPVKYVPFSELYTRTRREIVESDKKALADAIASLDGCLLPEGANIEFVYPLTITPAYWLAGCNDEMSKAILGRSMTTDDNGSSLGTFSNEFRGAPAWGDTKEALEKRIRQLKIFRELGPTLPIEIHASRYVDTDKWHSCYGIMVMGYDVYDELLSRLEARAMNGLPGLGIKMVDDRVRRSASENSQYVE